jgi:hypothetical protein
MTSTDVTRVYALLDELRREQRRDMTALHDEVVGYRADLNGRLKALELSEAKRQGEEDGRGSIGRVVLAVAAVSASIGSIVGVVAAIL